MKDQRALKLQLLSHHSGNSLRRKRAARVCQVLAQQAFKIVCREIGNRQQVFLHANGIAHDQTTLAFGLCDDSGFRYPVRPCYHTSFVQAEIAVIRQREAGQTKATAGAQSIRPFRQHPLQVVLDEGVLQHVSGCIGDQRRLRYRVLAGGVVGIGFFAGFQDPLAQLGSQQFKQLGKVVFLERLPHFPDLAESVRLDFEFDGIIRRVFQQGVARIEFEIAGHVAKTDQNRTAKSVCLTVTD